MGKKAALNANVLDVEEGGRHEADQMGRRNKQTRCPPLGTFSLVSWPRSHSSYPPPNSLQVRESGEEEEEEEWRL